jgi:drug/metabolite transporter (DMT)-like permease
MLRRILTDAVMGFMAALQGYMFGLLSAVLSAFAGVYTEYLMKQNDDCLYWQVYTVITLLTL